MIISASRRTDIPRFFAPWFIDRIREGYCLVPNPRNPRQITRISLDPADVTALVFWTRFPEPLLSGLDEIEARGIPYYFQYTITGYPPHYEKNAPALPQTLECFQKIARRIGPERIIWRYDPIFFTKDMDAEWHLANFSRISRALAGHCRQVIISLMDEYRKTLVALREEGIDYAGNPLHHPGLRPFLAALSGIAASCGMTMASCAESTDFAAIGISHAHCIDATLIARLTGKPFAWRKDRSQRPSCGCTVSRDIGTPDTCRGGCIYCYATRQKCDTRGKQATRSESTTLQESHSLQKSATLQRFSALQNFTGQRHLSPV